MTKRLARAGVAGAALILMLSSGTRPAAQQQRTPLAYPPLLSASRALAFAQAAAEQLPYVPGEVLIKFRDGVTVVEQDRALSALRSRPPAGGLQWNGGIALLRDASESNAELLAERLTVQPEVEYAEPNYLYKLHATPNDPSFATRQWNFTTLDMEKAWDINPGARQDIVVAVVDTGLTTVNATYTMATWSGTANVNIQVPFRTNPDLSPSKLTRPYDFVFWEGPVLDMDGHGTHVASTVGQDANNQLSGVGIAYQASIMPLKACLGYWDIQFTLSAEGYDDFVPPGTGGCPTGAIAEAIRYAADNGAKVINISLGGPNPSTTLRLALEYAVARGAFIAVAMGNEYDEGNPVEYPAAYAADIRGVMSVGAVGRSLKRAEYSSTGSHTEIAAPGGDSSDGGSSGLVWQATLDPDDNDEYTVIFPRFDRYAERGLQGTSMASPHVAGTAALLVSQGITNPAAVEALISRTARDLGAPGRDEEYGFGLIQPRTALLGLGVAR